MKEIKLVCDAPFFDKVDVNVLDFPSGPEGEPRRRCKITVEFGPYDLAQLKSRDWTTMAPWNITKRKFMIR